MRLVPIARVGSPHGVKGWLKVSPFASDLEILQNTTGIYIGSSEESSVKYKIACALPGPRGIRLKLDGIDVREIAAKLVGHFIYIPEKELPPIEEEDAYYAFQLVGLRVEDENGGVLGKITDILSTGSNDVLIIKGHDEAEFYLPAIKAAIRKIDLNNGLVTVESSWLT